MTETVTKEKVRERVFAALEEFGAEPQHITLEAEFEALDIDSLDLVELAQIVEDDFGVELKGEDIDGIRTVGQAVDLVVSRLP
jgi:acyl carrier protein